MRANATTFFLVVAVLATASIAPSPAEAGWGSKGTLTFRANTAGEKAPSKPPLPVTMVVPQDNANQICLTSTKGWAQNNGKVAGKAGGVWRENAAGELEKVVAFTIKKTKFRDGVAVRCKDVGQLLKGDIVEINPKFSSLKNTEAVGDKLVATISQSPAP